MEKEQPLVTIYIPCRNYGHFLNQAVKSVINQVYKSWELIIVDEGSKDDTSNIADLPNAFTDNTQPFESFTDYQNRITKVNNISEKVDKKEIKVKPSITQFSEAQRNFNLQTGQQEFSGGDNPVQSRQTVLNAEIKLLETKRRFAIKRGVPDYIIKEDYDVPLNKLKKEYNDTLEFGGR